MDVPRNSIDLAKVLPCFHLGTDRYDDLLNTGFKVTASAVSDGPYDRTIGALRMRAYVGDSPFSADAWLEAVRWGHLSFDLSPRKPAGGI